LVSQELYNDHVAELASILGKIPPILDPIFESFLEPGRVGLLVNPLSVGLGDLERFGGQVWDIFVDKQLRVHMSWIQLLRQISSERHDTGP
jgi:hypothetical protein